LPNSYLQTCKLGITKEVFQAEGKTPDWSETLKMVVKGNGSEKAQFFRNMSGTPCGPLDESLDE
jgi:hypothetical protein